MNRRGEVIQYVTEKYGREQVAQIITFNTLGARAAIKDVGRVLEMPFADVERLTKLVPNVLNISLTDAMEQEPGFDEAAKKDPRDRRRAEGGAAPGRPGAQLLGARRGRGDFAAAAQRTGAALQDQPRRNCDAVRHERPGEALAAQDGFPGPDHAHAHPGCAAPDRETPRRGAGPGRSAAGRQGHLRNLLQGLHQRRVPVRIAAACATSCGATSPAAWKTSPRSTRSTGPARSRAAWWTISSSASGAAARCSTICRS